MAKSVVGGALFAVLQDLIGLIHVFEALFRYRVSRIAVRVVLHGKLSVGLFDLTIIGVATDAQRVVKIVPGHGSVLHESEERPPVIQARQRKRR